MFMIVTNISSLQKKKKIKNNSVQMQYVLWNYINYITFQK